MHHDGEVSLEFLGDARGSVQISQSQSGVVGVQNLEPELEQELVLSPNLVGDGPESLGNAGGSGQNCVSQANNTFCEFLRGAGSSDQLDDGDSDQISQTQSAVTSSEFFVATDMATDTVMATATATAMATSLATDMALDTALDTSNDAATDTATATATVTAMDLEQASAMAPAIALDMSMDSYTAPDTASVLALAPATDITTATATVTALDSEPAAMAHALALSLALASQSDDDVSHSSHRSEESSEEFEFTGDDIVAKGEKKQKLDLRSSSRKKNCL